MPRRPALQVAQYAREHVPLYRARWWYVPYPLTSATFRTAPLLTSERLRATPLAEQVDSLRDTQRSVTPYRLATRATPAALVTDAEDTDSFYDEAKDAFRLLGVQRGAVLALVSPPEQRYFAAELSDRLGYAGIRAHLVIDRSATSSSDALTALRPDLVVAAGPASAVSVTPDITIRDPAREGADIYLAPEVGMIAVRRAAGEPYRLLPGYVHIETNPDGRLIVTSLLRHHQPVIRYLTGDRGRLVRGRLWLSEVAP